MEGNIPLSALSDQATNTEIFPNLNHSLISLDQLCDDNCIITLTKQDRIIKKNNKTILQGKQSTSGDKLWQIPFPQNPPVPPIPSCPQPTSQSIIIIIPRVDNRAHNLATYLHTACFSPTKSVFLQAIKNNFLT